jgi:autotransporter-associated beta strand protein
MLAAHSIARFDKRQSVLTNVAAIEANPIGGNLGAWNLPHRGISPTGRNGPASIDPCRVSVFTRASSIAAYSDPLSFPARFSRGRVNAVTSVRSFAVAIATHAARPTYTGAALVRRSLLLLAVVVLLAMQETACAQVDRTLTGLGTNHQRTTAENWEELGTGDLTIDQTTDTKFAGAITGTGSLIKSGAGAVAIQGAGTVSFMRANTYSGPTAVHAGAIAGDGIGKEEWHRATSRTESAFYGQVDALLWQQETNLNGQSIVTDANTGDTFLSTSNLDSNSAPGVRATIGKKLCNGKRLELSYLGLNPGAASANAISPDGTAFLIFPDNFFGNVFVGFDGATANYRTVINGLGANLICGDCCCDCGDPCGCNSYCCDSCGCEVLARPLSFEWVGGLQYLQVRDELNIATQRVVNGGVEDGDYNIRTVNNLYGAQLGGQVRRWPQPWGWEATGKGGIFANDLSQRQYVNDFPNFPIRPTTSRSNDTVAFVGDFNLTGLYRLTDAWVLRAGYSVFWMQGVALAPDQLDFNFATTPSGDQLDSDGGILLHGVNLGLEANW